MRKPSLKQFYAFKQLFDKINAEENLRQWLIPYFISSYPACKEEVYEIIIIFKRSTSMEALRYLSGVFSRAEVGGDGEALTHAREVVTRW